MVFAPTIPGVTLPPKKPTLLDLVRKLLLARMQESGSSKTLPPLFNRADARRHLPGNGPFMHFVVAPKEKSKRRISTRGKRREQRGHEAR